MLNLDTAIVGDIETFPNCFLLNVQGLFSDLDITFEISPYRDDRVALLAWFEHWRENQTPFIGFNNLAFDYTVLHFIRENPHCSAEDICEFAQTRINDHTYFGLIWESDRFCPQIDVFKINHFENPNKKTSLKALQFAMRSESVMESPVPFDQPLTREEIDVYAIPYCRHDVKETKRFALFTLDTIKFRNEIKGDLVRGDVLNWNDVKIGAKLVEQRLGDDVCYTWESGRKMPRQTIRETIALNDIIFPHVRFENAEFSRVLAWLRTQTLTSDEVTEKLKTKGVFHGVKAHVGGVDFVFGLGGMHASVDRQCFVADAENAIVDIDVAGMYPANMIANRLYPEHLGEKFVEVFAGLPIERAKYKKGTPRNKGFKLGGNGTFGNTNNVHSVFLDPQVTMATTLNGQLLICMLTEWLLEVPTLQIIQANTDGITYRIGRGWLEHAKAIRGIWEGMTRLVLEEVQYSRMWIRDVNNYVAESVAGKLKRKGAYWAPKDFDEITEEGAWHKDFSAQVVIKAAVEHMVTGVDVERFIYGHQDPFDFMIRAKCDRSSHLMIGDQEQQRILRYYIATDGGPLRKVSPPVKGARVGEFKRRSGISDQEYYGVLATLPPGTHDPRIHTKNKSTHTIRETGIDLGFLVRECNVASRFDFGRLNYEYYVSQAKKLVIE
ncbi:hypothetical protein ACRAVF_19285 [Bradyrhizobium oligotrophicum S58]